MPLFLLKMMLKFPIILFVISRVQSAHQLIEIIPTSSAKVAFLNWLAQSPLNTGKDLDFWKLPTSVNDSVHLMVSPAFRKRLKSMLRRTRIPYNVTINNLDSFIIQSQGKIHNRKKRNSEQLDFANYQTFESMEHYLRTLSNQYSSISRLYSIGQSHEKRDLWVMEITSQNFNSASKTEIWLDGGVHAREWISPHVALYVINELLSKYGSDETITKLLENTRWYIAPNMNPDGYVHTWSNASHIKTRMWRKNRSPERCVLVFGKLYCCQGVDLNRNFDAHWGGKGHTSSIPCHSYFQGRRPFSEPETQAIKNFVLPRLGSIRAFVSLHTYGQMWLHPFGYGRKTYPYDVKELRRIAKQATKALYSVHSVNYRVGSAADLWYNVPGTSIDWAKEQGIKYTYLLEMRPTQDSGSQGFLVDQKYILPTAQEVFQGLVAMAQTIVDTPK